jgi:hypothetical protein
MLSVYLSVRVSFCVSPTLCIFPLLIFLGYEAYEISVLSVSLCITPTFYWKIYEITLLFACLCVTPNFRFLCSRCHTKNN